MSVNIVPPPMGLLAELTHRCPLQCPYCSNPLELEAAAAELTTAEWCSVLDQAAAIGVLQVHFSGGEPMARRDLPELVRHAADRGLYSNLITSGVLVNARRLDELQAAGLDHVQLSFQDTETASAERIGGMKGAQALKLEAARLIGESDMALTVNFVVHRQNLARVPDMVKLAEQLGAARVEIANTQYYGWGLLNRDALLPTRGQSDLANEQVEAARLQYKGRMVIDYVTADYHAALPKACMGGWARRFVNISPIGRVLPCHAAEILPGMTYPSIREHSLAEIWGHDPAFLKFRGTDWMPEPCRSCDRREIDWGGCRCQALLLTGDAANTDPACVLSPHHGVMQDVVAQAGTGSEGFRYRRPGGQRMMPGAPSGPGAQVDELVE
ncbi:pyrroloquinoline quinone biosynthesis protein PqqE [Lichenicoccus roseus]|uniref:PqqA peptide cyclase n=1 Tax=Lichenicoccus roseus TaxID=2683649 RepID=A0A5R9J9B0_9PROT|nr:pyrroloquinoline quinone biosynthesis protein PqqE [Lichenicoccus roseus]TLU72171.1 pyrroloquinoline quinone biosynthesis protein PqqE [Lichenicoccus roseus]